MKTHLLYLLFIMGFPVVTFTQNTVVKGSVLDGTSGAPILGVIITIENTLLSTTTDAEGRFTLTQELPLGEHILKLEKNRTISEKADQISRKSLWIKIVLRHLVISATSARAVAFIPSVSKNISSENRPIRKAAIIES